MVEKRLVAKAALFNENGDLLLVRRSNTDTDRPGEWDLPGGGVDKGESFDEAVVREISEEIGINMPRNDVELMYAVTTFYEDISTTRFLYIGKILGEQVISLSYEHDLYVWLPIDEALEQYGHPVWVGGIQYLVENKLIYKV